MIDEQRLFTDFRNTISDCSCTSGFSAWSNFPFSLLIFSIPFQIDQSKTVFKSRLSNFPEEEMILSREIKQSGFWVKCKVITSIKVASSVGLTSSGDIMVNIPFTKSTSYFNNSEISWVDLSPKKRLVIYFTLQTSFRFPLRIWAKELS